MSYLDNVIESFNNSTNDIITNIENFNYAVNNSESITEAEYTKKTEHLKMELLDVDKFIDKNECKQITNPVFYDRDNIPSRDGLLSNEIFGITMSDRAGIFAYIDLHQYFIDPSCYKAWTRIDSKIRDVVHKNGTFSVNSNGEIVEDPAGKNGVKFLKANIDKIKFKSTESMKRDLKVKYLELNRNKMFINKYIVIPPYYRDTNTGKRSVGVGGINKLYSQVLICANSLSTTQDYGFDLSGPTEGRIQELLLAIYDWFAGNTNNTIKVEEGVGISGKTGLLRRANMTKTANYSARLVISAPDVRSNRPGDMMVNYDFSAIPLHAAMACYRPFVQFYVRKFFENEFIGTETYPVTNKEGKTEYITPVNPLIQFSDERIVTEMERFIHSKNNRLTPVILQAENGKEYYMIFEGNFANNKQTGESIYTRILTWCDIFYVAATRAVKGKMALITRYPVDITFNQITTQLVISSTKDTEPMYYNNEYFPYYPKIREDDIGKGTENSFIDTMRICNIYLPGMTGDYDGDTVSVKGVFTDEANEELMKKANDKMNFVNFAAKSTRTSGGQVAQSLYNLTLILNSDKDKLKEVSL